MKEVKCRNCGHWNPADNKVCDNCQLPLHDQKYQPKEDDPRKRDTNLPMWKIKEGDSSFKRGAKQTANYGQIIFFTIISFIAAMASSTVH